MINLAIFGSGEGTNFENVINWYKDENPKNINKIVAFINKKSAKMIQRAKNHNINYCVLELSEFHSKNEYEKAIIKYLDENKINFIFLLGYMTYIGDVLLDKYEGRMINLHPTLLPKFPGKDALERSYRANEEFLGATIHYVDKGIDTGRIISQEKVKNNFASLDEAKVAMRQVEHTLVIKTLQKIIKE